MVISGREDSTFKCIRRPPSAFEGLTRAKLGGPGTRHLGESQETLSLEEADREGPCRTQETDFIQSKVERHCAGKQDSDMI